MKEKFRGKYRIESARMPNWDYGWRGYYFVTICTKGRACYFGEIVDKQMILSEMGEVAKSEWLKSPKIRPDMNIALDEYIIMPNHIHGIIQIGKNEYNKFDDEIIVDHTCGTCCRGAMHGAPTTGTTNKLNGPNPIKMEKSGPQRKNLSSIIRGFKSAVTTHARMINSDFVWQSRFHDHVIRDNRSLNNIRQYIRYNPWNWEGDKLHS